MRGSEGEGRGGSMSRARNRAFDRDANEASVIIRGFPCPEVLHALRSPDGCPKHSHSPVVPEATERELALHVSAAVNSATPAGTVPPRSRLASSPDANGCGHGPPTLVREPRAPSRPWRSCTPRTRHRGTETTSHPLEVCPQWLGCCSIAKNMGTSGSPCSPPSPCAMS